MSNKKRLMELAGVTKRVPENKMKPLKLSALSEGLQKKVRKHIKDGKVRLSELPDSIKEQIKQETTKPSLISEAEFLPIKPKMNPKEYLEITTPLGGGDFDIFKTVVNQGIDSHLEAFTKSKFEGFMQDGQKRMCFNFHKSEVPILLRRLEEMGNEEADSWASDIRDSEGL
jgi:hypothetical protein